MGSKNGVMPRVGDLAPEVYGTAAPPVYLPPYEGAVPEPSRVRPPRLDDDV